MKKNIILFFTLVVLISKSCSFFLGRFAEKVQPALQELAQMHQGIRKCIETAQRKAESVDGVPSWDGFYAVVLINMYSNPSCHLSSKKDRVFYKELNEELQNNLQTSPESNLWLHVGELMNEAFEVIGLRYVTVVYRGCNYKLDFSGPEFRFRRITSTTKVPLIASIYSGCETFLLIEDALGLDIEKYSQVPDEEEILLQSTNIYLVEKHTNNETEIKREMENILPDQEYESPRVFVRLRQIKLDRYPFRIQMP